MYERKPSKVRGSWKQTKRSVSSLVALLAGFACATHPVMAAAGERPETGSGTAPTPPMGFNPYNAFAVDATEDQMMAIARKLVDSGLAAKGYRYVNIDDGWWLKRRAGGKLEVNTKAFPSADIGNGQTSFLPYVTRLHAMGLKAGIYTDIGRNACSQAWRAGDPNLPVGTVAEREIGSMDHQAADMRQIFGEWKFDFIKIDACGVADFEPTKANVKDGQFRALGPWMVRGRPSSPDDAKVEQLYATLNKDIEQVRPKRDYVLSICNWGEAGVAAWGQRHGNSWRTSGDINASWTSMLANFDTAAANPEAAGPNHWNDPDMLEIGNGEFDADHLVEAKAQMSMWAIISAPLLLGSDITHWPQSLFDVAGNSEVIAIDQDPAGHQGVIISKADEAEILVKRLAKADTRAVALINRSSKPISLSVSLAQLGLPSGATTMVRNLWSDEEHRQSSDMVSASLAPHETALLRVSLAQSPN